jgi:Type IX secretion system protein PorV
MRLMTTGLAVLLVLSLASGAHAQGTGRSLDIQPGARWNGMGAAGVAVADDASGAAWWNPAGLGFVERSSVQLTSAQLVPGLATDVMYNYASWVHPVEGWGAFGLGFIFLSYGESEGSDTQGNLTQKFNSYEFAPGMYYGTRILPDLSIGAALKYIHIQLAPNSMHGVGSTFGLDLAGLYKIPAWRLNFGVNVQNLGPSVTFINEDDASPLSRNVRGGLAWTPVQTKQISLLMVGDFNQSLVTRDFRVYNGGAELRYADQLALRIGYYDDPLGDIGDITYGLGFTWKQLTFDIAGIPQAKDSGLDYVKKVSLGYCF